MKLYTYQTHASDVAQRLSGIEHTIEACDGLNFGKALRQLCLVMGGRLNCLSYRKQVEEYEQEQEYVALRIIQTVTSAWVALRARKKFPKTHPHHPFWRKHDSIYESAVLACRDQRLRTLNLLLKLVRRQKPAIDLIQFLDKEKKRSGKQEHQITGLKSPGESTAETDGDSTSGGGDGKPMVATFEVEGGERDAAAARAAIGAPKVAARPQMALMSKLKAKREAKSQSPVREMDMFDSNMDVRERDMFDAADERPDVAGGGDVSTQTVPTLHVLDFQRCF